MVEILNFLKRVQLGIKGLQNMTLFHHTRHENGNSDEINIAELSGELADPQRPKVHALTHRKGEIDDLESSLKLANFNEKAHTSLASVSANQHHPQSHTLASHSTKAHSELTGIGASDHHSKTTSGEISLANLLEKAHGSLTGVTSDQHHNRGKLIESFTAGEDLNANETVYLSSANTVSKATNANATKAIGVTIEAVSSGEPVDVCIAGKATGIADEAISVGDILTPAAVAGRLAVLTTNTNSTGTHTHTQGATESAGSHVHAQGVTGSGGSHSHTQGATGSNGNHSHTQGNTGSAGSHSHTQGATGSNGNHSHTQGNTGSADINHRHSIGTSSVASGAGSAHIHKYDKSATATGTPSATHSVITAIQFEDCPDGHASCQMGSFYIGKVAHESHTHIITLYNVDSGSESSHTHNYDKVSSQSGYTNPSHAHSNPNTNTTGSHTHTNPTTSEVASHAHSNPNTNTTGSHTHTNPTTSEAASHTHTNPNTESGGSHTHTNPDTNSAGAHNHTTNIGKVLAKAITAASNPGDTITLIICLGA